MMGILDASDQFNPGHYGPSQTALLLLDFHSVVVEKFCGPKAPAALAVAAGLRTWAKSQGIVVIHTLIDTTKKPFPTAKDATRLAAIMASISEDGSDESLELLQDVTEDEPTFSRIPGYVSALQSPGLHEFLHAKGIKSLVLAGLSTSGCLLRTAIPATEAEYVVSVISDGCADAGEGIHDFLIEKILPVRAYVLTAAQFRDEFAEVVKRH